MENQRFLNNEEKTNILDWRIEDVPLWRFERFMVHRYLHEVETNSKSSTEVTQEYKKGKMGQFIKLYLKYRLSSHKKSEILIFDHRRRVFENGQYICKYTESISDHFQDSVTYEVPYNDSHLEPAKTRNLYYLDRLILRSYAYELFIRKFSKKRYKADYAAIKDKLIGFTENEYSDEVYNYLAKSLTKNLFLIKYRRKHIKKLISSISPKIIIEVVGYSQNNMIINEMARELGVPTVEIQHSQINRDLIQYNFGNRKDIEQFPEYLFTFGEFWSMDMNMPIKDENIRAVGFPYFEKGIEEARQKGESEELKSDVLFISQFLAGPSVYKLAMEYCDLNPDSKVVYKLHPEEYGLWEERYPRLKEYSNVNVITDSSITLYDCFVNTKAVVGVFSGALYEALAFDLPVYLYNADYIEYMQRLIDVKGAIVVDSVEELDNCLKNGIKAKTPDYEIWKKDSLNNIIKEINLIKEKK